MLRDILSKNISILKRKSTNKDLRFKVSAIVLCYNGEKYIEKRLQSIIQQTYQPYEIILLDDSSTDNSVKIAKELLKKSKIKIKIIMNEKNIGVGNQLLKGMEESKGDFVWFTEQDDYCRETFLERMKQMFEEDSVNISYCRSIPVDENGFELKGYYKKENALEDYCVDGILEMKNNLCIKNTIYDISSVVFRKTTLNGVEEEIPKFRVFYDWMLYAHVLRFGKISYCAEALNCHMRHTNSIIAKNRQSDAFYDDLFLVKNYILDHYLLPKPNMLEMLYEIDRDYRMNNYNCGSREIKKHPRLGPEYTKLQNKINEHCKRIKYK